MWGNKENRKSLGGVIERYQIVGLNQDRLIAELKRKEITLLDVKKSSNRVMYISVNLRESHKFFAITKNLCYNIKKVGIRGRFAPVYHLLKNFGLALGALIFILLAGYSNDFILGFNYSGSGSVYSRQVQEYLEGRGITRLSRFSSFKTERLEDEILADNANLTFVSVRKKGNTLRLYLTLKVDGAQNISGKATELRATEGGIIESLKIYRGSALVAVGDRVEAGDLLVEGFVDIKEQRVETGVLAYVTLLQEKSYSYRLEGLGEEQVAIALAGEEWEREMLSCSVTVKEISGEENLYLYTVKASYRCVIYAQ